MPSWGGIKDQTIVANQDVSGIIYPQVQVLSDNLLSSESNGARGDGAVDATYTFTSPANGSYYHCVFVTQEKIVPTDWIHFEVFEGTGVEGTRLFMQDYKGHSLDAGDDLSIEYGHPVDVHTGDTVTIAIYIGDQDHKTERLLQVLPGTTNPTDPYRKYWYRTFTNYPISHRGSTIEANWTRNGTTLSPTNAGDIININNIVSSLFTINDGVEDRLILNATNSTLEAPNGNYRFNVTNTGAYVSAPEGYLEDAQVTRFGWNATGTRMYSPNGTYGKLYMTNNDTTMTVGSQYLQMNGAYLKFNDGTRDRFKVDATSTLLHAANGNHHIEFTDTHTHISDSSRYRLMVSAAGSFMYNAAGIGIHETDMNATSSIFGTKYTRVDANGFTYHDGTSNRLEITSTNTKITGDVDVPGSVNIGSSGTSVGPAYTYLTLDRWETPYGGTGLIFKGPWKNDEPATYYGDAMLDNFWGYLRMIVGQSTIGYHDWAGYMNIVYGSNTSEYSVLHSRGKPSAGMFWGTATDTGKYYFSGTGGMVLQGPLDIGGNITKTGTGALTLTTPAAGFYLKDATRNRFMANTAETEMISPNGNHEIYVSNVGAQLFDGVNNKARFIFNSTDSRMVAPNGGSHVLAKNAVVEVYDGTRNRFTVDATYSTQTSPDGSFSTSLSNAWFQVSDDVRNRIDIDVDHSALISPDGSVSIHVHNTESPLYWGIKLNGKVMMNDIVEMSALPENDPSVAGRLWKDSSNFVKVSEG